MELPILKRFVFPATLRQLKLSYAQSEVVDLSRCTHLKSLYVFESGAGERAIKKLILPKNLKKSDFKRQHKSEFENDYAFKLSDISNETVIENLPRGLKMTEMGRIVYRMISEMNMVLTLK